ncbi:MFS general substrate transporter [Aaosphaeria arxii CBS 175.79]|uniref:MFS general substrate transporter n=1 Tax=Aaosphaeria arxii CBS 175.79 TaxID=1450172 RepID=A0A6A5XF07_9PLEO|nr:MFS general substrate transporter [Aaosphaeria arxii CBS 175.79]KAF2011513.1 MFS general substrate transporter [Aaosphaeria arxii CBS 175.79]
MTVSIKEDAYLDEKKTIADTEKVEQVTQEYDEDTRALEKRLVRKLDMTLMPVVWVLYFFNYMDRNNIAQAKLNSFEKDLGLKGNQFNVAVSILNVGYVLMQLPSNMILTKVRPSIYIPACAMLWSCVSAATSGVHNYGGLIGVRFVLGIVEAPFWPGAFYMLSSWYTRKELALRTAVLYSGLVLATAFSGLVAAGVFAGLDGVRGLAGWKWLFIIEGAASFFAAIVSMFILPDFPESTSGSGRWLFNEAEKKLAVDRIARDRVSAPQVDESIMHGLKLAVSDYRTWVFSLMLCANHSAYGFNNFFPSIVKGFNLGSRTITLVCTAPPYLVGTVVSFAIAFSSDRNKERGFHISVPLCVAAAGFIITVSTLNVPARYFASFLYIGGCFGSNAIVYTWAASTLNQTPAKRACATAIVNIMSQMGNIYSPYFFRPQDAPRYIPAMLLMMSFSIISIVTCMVMKTLLRKANNNLLKKEEETGIKAVLYPL